MSDSAETAGHLEQHLERKAKLQSLRANHATAYPNDFRRNTFAQDILEGYEACDQKTLESDPVSVTLAGRMMTRRLMGKASFAHIQDMTGRIQIYVKSQVIGQVHYDAFKQFDLGDILGVAGTLFRTKTGELSIYVQKIRLLTKSLRPLPDKFHGLTDQEKRYRQRYLDLIVNESTRKLFHTRAMVITTLRNFFVAKRFLEVETPMMHPMPGGASARPFKTHHNALDMPLYLRIAPELYLKRLVIGGMERVFEINRNFRNEGLSTRHNPEFTMIECYLAYADYKDLMALTESLMRYLVKTVSGSLQLTYQGRSYDFAPRFACMSLRDSILHVHKSCTAQDVDTKAGLMHVCKQHGITYASQWEIGKLQYVIFEKTVEPLLMNPTFITDFPTAVSPLAKRHDSHPDIVERFEFFVAGRELANGFSELNDPEDQAARFKAQAVQHAAGDTEAMRFDADYIQALEYGLPPTAGEGIGIDRLVMLLTDAASIRDVILFPHLRPGKNAKKTVVS